MEDALKTTSVGCQFYEMKQTMQINFNKKPSSSRICYTKIITKNNRIKNESGIINS